MNLSRTVLVSLSTLALSLVPLVAHAEGPQTGGGPVVVEQTQQPPPNYQQPPPGGGTYDQNGQPVVGQPGYGQPGYAQPGPGQPGYGAPPPPMGPMVDRGRFRFAFDIGGMGFWGQGNGGAVDASVHLGWQLDRLMAVYLLARGFVGGWGASDGRYSGAGGIIAGFHIGPAMDFTFGDFFQLGFGLTFDELGAAGVSVSGSSAGEYAFGGAGLGIDGRIALLLGGGDPAIRRSGFQFVVNVHPTLGFGTEAQVDTSTGATVRSDVIYGVFDVSIGIGYCSF